MNNPVKQKIRHSEPSFGGWCLTASPVAAEIMAMAGFDWVCIDAEHTAVSKETAQQIVQVIERRGSQPFVRVALNDEIEIKRFLDMGATGIIVPMVRTAAEAERAVSYCKYPPEGKRSYSLARSTGYGAHAQEAFDDGNDLTFLAIMIEDIAALEQLDAILATPGIDAVLVGPYDLSGSMGIPGQLDDSSFREALAAIYTRAAEHGIPMGVHEVHPTPENLQEHVAHGFRFIGCGLDTLFIADACKGLLASALPEDTE